MLVASKYQVPAMGNHAPEFYRNQEVYEMTGGLKGLESSCGAPVL